MTLQYFITLLLWFKRIYFKFMDMDTYGKDTCQNQVNLNRSQNFNCIMNILYGVPLAYSHNNCQGTKKREIA